jgi:hypothetical protein
MASLESPRSKTELQLKRCLCFRRKIRSTWEGKELQVRMKTVEQRLGHYLDKYGQCAS